MKAKRVMMAVFASAAILSMSVNAMAGGSITNALDTNKVTASTVEKKIVGGKEEVVTKEVGVKLEQVKDDTFEDKDIQKEVDILNDADAEINLKDAFALAYEKDKMPQIDLYNAEGLKQEDMDLSEFKFLSPVMNLTLETEPTEEEPVEVTFTVNNLTDKIEPFILHRCEKHGWELLETEKVTDEEAAAEDTQNVETETTDAAETAETADTDKQIKATFHSAGGPIAVVYRLLPEKAAETDTEVVAP